MRRIFLMSSVLFVAPFTAGNAAAQCITATDCASLGYDMPSCSDGKGIKCPYGNKYACPICASSYRYSCTGSYQSPKAPLAKTNMKAVTARITVLGQTVPALATQTTNIPVREQTKQNHLHLFPAAENMLPVAAFLPTLGLTDNVLICVLLVTKVAKTEIRCSHGEAKQAS